SSIDRLDEERAPAIGTDLCRERGREGFAGWLRVRLIGDECEELLFAATEPSSDPAIDKDDERTRGAHGLAALGTLGPRKGRAVRIGRIGRRDDDGVRLFGPFARGAKPIDSTGQRELRGAEARDEVAAPNAARVLHGLQ